MPEDEVRKKLKYLWDSQQRKVERVWVEADPDTRPPNRKSIRGAHELHLLKKKKSKGVI